jgi:hypothetical protein
MQRKPADVFDDGTFALDTLLHPTQIFEHPSDVVANPAVSLNEKRAILAAWASDACAVEASPALRKNPRGRTVPFDDIMDALRALDQLAGAACAADRLRSVRGRLSFGGTGSGDQGSPLH